MTGPRTALVVFIAAFAADLLLKAWVVANEDAFEVVYNARKRRLGSRLVLSAVAVAVTWGLSRLARWRGYDEIWGAWIGVALLVAGVLANGCSRLLWSRGVPDYLPAGDWFWNLADLMIAIGITGGILSLCVTALMGYAGAVSSRRS